MDTEIFNSVINKKNLLTTIGVILDILVPWYNQIWSHITFYMPYLDNINAPYANGRIVHPYVLLCSTFNDDMLNIDAFMSFTENLLQSIRTTGFICKRPIFIIKTIAERKAGIVGVGRVIMELTPSPEMEYLYTTLRRCVCTIPTHSHVTSSNDTWCPFVEIGYVNTINDVVLLFKELTKYVGQPVFINWWRRTVSKSDFSILDIGLGNIPYITVNPQKSTFYSALNACCSSTISSSLWVNYFVCLTFTPIWNNALIWIDIEQYNTRCDPWVLDCQPNIFSNMCDNYKSEIKICKTVKDINLFKKIYKIFIKNQNIYKKFTIYKWLNCDFNTNISTDLSGADGVNKSLTDEEANFICISAEVVKFTSAEINNNISGHGRVIMRCAPSNEMINLYKFLRYNIASMSIYCTDKDSYKWTPYIEVGKVITEQDGKLIVDRLQPYIGSQINILDLQINC